MKIKATKTVKTLYNWLVVTIALLAVLIVEGSMFVEAFQKAFNN